ncbi:hypothetical protein AVEN_150782-1 [Araneus ventricosus]|uniref:Secreted protein n=1 Tax=Araneus ventricosus TaxID=182803 RepID=A0A4Y2G8M0_ARAVE|nr:hypothetical protein AVEN_150782-1 [Araneus ventricosus]
MRTFTFFSLLVSPSFWAGARVVPKRNPHETEAGDCWGLSCASGNSHGGRTSTKRSCLPFHLTPINDRLGAAVFDDSTPNPETTSMEAGVFMNKRRPVACSPSPQIESKKSRIVVQAASGRVSKQYTVL